MPLFQALLTGALRRDDIAMKVLCRFVSGTATWLLDRAECFVQPAPCPPEPDIHATHRTARATQRRRYQKSGLPLKNPAALSPNCHLGGLIKIHSDVYTDGNPDVNHAPQQHCSRQQKMTPAPALILPQAFRMQDNPTASLDASVRLALGSRPRNSNTPEPRCLAYSIIPDDVDQPIDRVVNQTRGAPHDKERTDVAF